LFGEKKMDTSMDKTENIEKDNQNDHDTSMDCCFLEKIEVEENPAKKNETSLSVSVRKFAKIK
jgi:hypothetical protein